MPVYLSRFLLRIFGFFLVCECECFEGLEQPELRGSAPFDFLQERTLITVIAEGCRVKMNAQQIIEFVLEPAVSSSSSSSDTSSDTSSNATNTDTNESVDDGQDILLPIMQLLFRGERRYRIQNYLDTVNRWSDAEFREHLRLERLVAYEQIDALSRSEYIPSHDFGKPKITAEWSFLMLLWYVSNTEPLRTVADRFDVSISSVFRVIRRVVSWLISNIGNVIIWPQGNNIIRTSVEFERKKGITKCIGAIDGTHIQIIEPHENARDYCNRKHYYSVILQGVVDVNLKFTNIYCGEPGSMHDARVLRRSPLFHNAQENTERLFPNSTFIIGDSAYPLLRWLIPLFRDNGYLTPQQTEFNYLHSSTRMAVEKAFGLLKGRFRRLKFLELQDMQFISELITACCILHNICVDKGNPYDFDEEVVEGNIDEIFQNEIIDEGGRDAFDRRRALFHEMFPF